MKEEQLTRIVRREFQRKKFNPKKVKIVEFLPGVKRVLYADDISTYAFNLNLDRGLSHNGWLSVEKKFRQKGIGRNLVEARESICKKVDIPLVVVNHNSNPSFWRTLGYERLGILNFLKLRYELRNGEIFNNPVYKELTDF